MDVWGFSAIMTAGSPERVLATLQTCHLKVSGIWQHPVTTPQRFSLSDSIFLCYPISSKEQRFEALESLKHDVEQVSYIFANQGLPIRGAVTYGQVTYGANLLVGAPVVRAVRLEAQLPFPAVILPANECLDDNSEKIHPLAPRMRDVSITTGTLKGLHILPRPRDEFRQLVMDKAVVHGIHGPAGVARAWKELLILLSQDE